MTGDHQPGHARTCTFHMEDLQGSISKEGLFFPVESSLQTFHIPDHFKLFTGRLSPKQLFYKHVYYFPLVLRQAHLMTPDPPDDLKPLYLPFT